MPGRSRVLVIDGDALVANLLGLLLEKDGYDVLRAASAEEGFQLTRFNRPDAVILDIVLPGTDGFDTCRRLRHLTDAAILLVGPHARSEAAVRGLQLGADDCLGKPYAYDILASKLRAALNLRGRLSGPTPTQGDGASGFLLDPSHRRVFVRNGRCVSLTRREFALLQFLVDNHDRVVSPDDILGRVWGPEYVGDRDLVKQFIYRLRCKLEADPEQPKSILTVRGSGYTFDPETRPYGRLLEVENVGNLALRWPIPRLAGSRPEAARAREIRGPMTFAARAAPGRPPMRRAGGFSWGAGVLVLVLGLLATGVTMEVSSAAIPGDRLYPLKIGLEGLQYELASGESEDPAIHLRFARERIREVSALLAEGRLESLPGALASFEREMLAASWAVAHPGPVRGEEASALRAYLEAEARSHDEVLRGLLASAPDAARPGLEHALIFLNTGRGTSHALFIGHEAPSFSEPPWAVLPGDNASIMVGETASEGTAQAQPLVEIGLPPASTPAPTQVPYFLWIASNEGLDTVGSTTQVPILHPTAGSMEPLPTSSPTPTSGFPPPHAR